MFRPHLFFWFLALPVAAVARGDESPDFVRQIRPILTEHCYRCHGPDEAQRKAELRLDLRGGALGRLPSGKTAIVPGDAAASELWRRINHTDADVRMPPPEGKPLSIEQKDLLQRWIASGAKWPEHWSFASPRRPPLPELPSDLHNGVLGAIDLFVVRRLLDERLAPSPPADRRTLARRVTLDLTGVIPAPEEVERFLADASPDAYERLVDRLLASPRYGERMASDWMDAARYADTHGYHSDSQRDMWRWRQWVIDAYNANMPFDQFTIWQLAGDLLPNPTLEQRIATGFNRNHMLNDENGAIPEEYLCEYVADRVTTTATVWLGLTVTCARCHDHKYDPIPQRDFYKLYACFHNVPENGLGGRNGNAPPLIVAPTRLQLQEIAQFDAQAARLEDKLSKRAAAAARDQAAWENRALVRAGPLSEPPRDALVHLTFDELPPTDKLSDIRYHGNPALAAGKFGQALLCDGQTHVELPRRRFMAGGGLEQTDPFTLSLWVMATTADKGGLISSSDETLSGRGLELGLEDERLTFRMTHVAERDELLVRAAEKLPRSKWRHVAICYEGSGRAAGVNLYVDGQRQKLAVVRDTLSHHIATDQPIRIGRGDGESFFRGLLDDVRLFSRALSPTEAALLAGGDPIQDLLRIAPLRRTPRQQETIRAYFLEHHDGAYRGLWDELAAVRRRKSEIEQRAPTVMVMQELPQPRDTFVLQRGRYDQPAERVTAGTPEILPPMSNDLPRNRLGLALWLVRRDHPLTGRVTVNRLWQAIFGIGLVKTADDFGARGELPSHRDLLDWLAIEFSAGSSAPQSAWDVKRLARLIVTSAAYRQASRVTPELLARDRDNRLLARGPRMRMSAEALRDSALAAAGLLDGCIGGPSVRPYQPADLWKELAYDPREYSAQTYVPSRGADLYRRSLYTFRKRTVPPPAMTIFDATDREVCTVSRARTTTPLQGLVLLNDPTYVEAARHIAHRVMRHSPDDSQRMERLFMLLLSRPPRRDEAAVLLEQLFTERNAFAADLQAARDLLAVGQSPPTAGFDAAELAAWTTVASTMLNLDEAQTNH